MKHLNISENTTSIDRNTSYEGETIENKIERIVNNNEPIGDGAPLIYTERKDGVKAEYNVRTDRFEIAIDGMDAVSKSLRSKRDNIIKMDNNSVSGTESIQGTTD